MKPTLHNKINDGLPDIGRLIVVYNKRIREYEICKRLDKYRYGSESDAKFHISEDGEFYSATNGWIYPIEYDNYYYLDEMELTTKGDK